MGRWWRVAVAWGALEARAWGCGPEGAPPILNDAVLPPSHHAHLAEYTDDDPSIDRDDFPNPLNEFLYPFSRLDPALFAEIEANLEFRPDQPTPIATARVEARMHDYRTARETGELDPAVRAAERVVEEILDLPGPLAHHFAEDLREPVELLELAGALRRRSAAERRAFLADDPADPLVQEAMEVRGLDPALAADLAAARPDHPRMASLRWLKLRHDVETRVADGWSADGIRAATSADTFARLQAEADAWLRDYPNHPLADYVRLKKAELSYLSDDGPGAWRTLLALYPRHPLRAANEMRFLGRQGPPPPTDLVLTGLPPELVATLLPYDALTPAEWSYWWRVAASWPSAPGSLPLEERLLYSLTERDHVDLRQYRSFPKDAAIPSETWAELRLYLLMRAGRFAEAEAQAALFPDRSPTAGALRAQLAIRRGDWVAAIRQPGIDSPAYLVRVLAPESALARLARGSDDIAAEARLTLAIRRLERTGDWLAGGRALLATDPDRAHLWIEASDYASDHRPEGQLVYARFLMEHAGQILIERDRWWYRELPRWPPGEYWWEPRASGPAEWKAVVAWLERSFATYRALVAYAEWLDALDVDALDPRGLAEAWGVLREADDAYNALMNYDSLGDGYAWDRILAGSDVERTLRRVGKEIRARLPDPRPPSASP